MSAAVLTPILAIIGLATAWNLQGWPGRVDDDEGTYVAQAWAVIYEHTLTHYSYWYDHPPLGWIQIAAFAWITDGFNRVVAAVFVGREFMWCVTLACCVLLWVLCRRIGMRRVTSAATVLLFGLSPIAQFYHRLVSLDNIETMWVLAALVAATSPRRGWGAAARTGACAAIAVLSKETALICLPVIVWVLWQNPGRTRAAAAGAGAAAGDPAAADAVPLAGTDPGTAAAPGTAGGTAFAATVSTGAANLAGAAGAAGETAAPQGTAETVAVADPAGPGEAAESDRPVWMPDWSGWASSHAGDLRRMRAHARGAAAVFRRSGRTRRGPAPLAGLTAWLRGLDPRLSGFLVFAVTGCAIVALYPLYALQRGQISLLWSTLLWQFFDRPGSGSLLNTGSATYNLAHGWAVTDPWLLIAGLIAAVLVLPSRRLRPFGFAVLLQAAVLVHGAYLPYFYVTAILPFAALALGGAADALLARTDLSRLGAWTGRPGSPAGRLSPHLGRVIVAIAALTYVIHVAPEWVSSLDRNSTANGAAPYLAAATWAERTVPKNGTVVVDDYLWVDLKRHGLNPLWMWKIDGVTAPQGWKSINYIILQPQSAGTLAGIPALQAAYAHSVLVRNFGNGLTARKIVGG